MKHIVLLAPAVVPPLTEGRKKFVVDLADALQGDGLVVETLSGTPAKSSAGMTIACVHALRARLRSAADVDAVAVFPFGRFDALRGRVNAWFIRAARRLCATAGVPCLPVIYSCAGIDFDHLGAQFAPALAVGRDGAGVAPLHLGIRHPQETWRQLAPSPRRLLFLCGYQNASKAAKTGVMEERGLFDLLCAGTALAAQGMTLTVAIPFLRESAARGWFCQIAMRICPQLAIEMHDEVNPQALLLSHDAFVFPYRSEHAVFVPTSLLEAMSLGVPVIAAAQAMYASLTLADGQRCTLHMPGEPASLAAAGQRLINDYAGAVDRAAAAAILVRDEWTLVRAIAELRAAFSRLGSIHAPL